MAQADESITALRAFLQQPLRLWCRSNKVYIWSYCGLYYGLHLLYVAISLFALSTGYHPFSISHNKPLAIGYGITFFLLYVVAVLAVIKAPAMIVSEQEMQLAYSRSLYQRALVDSRTSVSILLVIILLLPYPVLKEIISLAAGGWYWPWDLMRLTTATAYIGFYLAVGVISVAMSFFNTSLLLEIAAAVVILLVPSLFGLIELKLGLLMKSTVQPLDQVVIGGCIIATWTLIFGSLIFYLRKKLIPLLAARYLAG